MQYARFGLFAHKAQMLGSQSVLPLFLERGRPGDAFAGARPHAGPYAASRERAVRPSKTAARIGSSGALPMAQRFFEASGMTPFTSTIPAGSGGR
ncbi:hypothetical protein B0G57_13419 [Trinickia symbiotica]|nr:hypothetical protein B0G57_13419 [Trinickia symbiotica]